MESPQPPPPRDAKVDQRPVYHRKYFLNDEPVIFLVEQTLFKVNRHFLVRESEVLRGMFECPLPVEGAEGTDEGRPIVLPGVLCREFERFLDFFYHGMYREKSGSLDPACSDHPDHPVIEQWIDLLSVSTRFDCERVRNRAIETIDSLPGLDPIRKIYLAAKHDIPQWRKPAFEDLCHREDPLNAEEARILELDDLVRLVRAREIVRHNHHTQPRRSHQIPTPTAQAPKIPPPKYIYDSVMVKEVVANNFG